MSEISIGDALQNFIKKSHWDGRINALKIEQNWEKIMGKTIAKYTDKIFFKNGALYIYTTVAPLKQELQSAKPQIIKRVNEFLKSKAVETVIIK